jgi:hypothetical protein
MSKIIKYYEKLFYKFNKNPFFLNKIVKSHKKIAISTHLPLSKLDYYNKKTHPKKAFYKQALLSLNTDNL